MYKCPKCGRFETENVDFENHHIIARMDGGTDEKENIIRLCIVCHTEWHSFECAYTLPFSEWIDLPSGHFLALTSYTLKRDPGMIDLLSEQSKESLLKGIFNLFDVQLLTKEGNDKDDTNG